MSLLVRRTTTINKVSNTSSSKKTTIPSDIVDILKLEDGDQIEWQAHLEDGEVVVYIEKIL